MWWRGNPLWTGPLRSMSLAPLYHILTVWLHLPVPQFANLYNGEINCHSLNLPLRAVVRTKWYSSWALASWSIVTMGLDSPRLLKENVFWLTRYISPLVEEQMAQHLTGAMTEGLYRKRPTVLMCWKIVWFFLKYPLPALQERKQWTKNSTQAHLRAIG